MKKLLCTIILIFFSFPNFSLSSDEPVECKMDMSNFTQTIPNYLQPWWNNTRIGKFAVIYVDFPDGRYISGNDTLQPFYDYQLEWVYANGEPDAAGEMGLVNYQTNIPVGSKYMKASKYNWYDRWNMFFDSVGTYSATAHPDWASHGDSAWGSFKNYWSQASNGKFELIPYVTHPNEQNYKLRTGIINDYEMINGVPIIKCFTLPKKKYGSDNSNSYFRSDSDVVNIPSASNAMNSAVIEILDDIGFNFTQEGGILFIYFAGSHRAFVDWSDITTYPQMSPLRLRELKITNENSRIDGFGASAHQFGHIQFGWLHTRSGRCDIMNVNDVHDNNSPQFPNPVYRMKEGWLQPIALESSTTVNELESIELSHECGVVTMFGKPSAAPDWSTGECFVVENRRRLGFDRKIVREDLLINNFLGGLLVWHYSPYYPFHNDPLSGIEAYIKLIAADGLDLSGSRGNPRSFFAYSFNLPPTPIDFYKLDSNKTYSKSQVKTGIQINNIEQNDYNSLGSTMNFDLNYMLAPPRNYSDVIYRRDITNHYLSYSDTVFYHEKDPYGFFQINPGTVIEAMPPVTKKYMG